MRIGELPIPTQSSTSTVAEAPRPARDQWDGRSPGSRVNAACRLPELSLADRPQWHRASARRLQLRGQPWDCIAAFGAQDAYHIPSSLLHSKEAIKSASTASRGGIVNGEGAREAAQRMRDMQRMRDLLSPPGRCITLARLSGARPSLGVGE